MIVVMRLCRYIPLIVLFATLSVLPACHTEPMELTSYEGAPPGQRYELDEVKRRLEELGPGMSRTEVLLTLGSPAKREGGDYLYLPSRPGLILPADAVRVHFENGRYVEWRWQPIILGERVDTP